MTTTTTVGLPIEISPAILRYSPEHSTERSDESGYVRRCQALSCKGAPRFEKVERNCRRCGRPRPQASATVAILGGSDCDYAMVRDALDAEFNSSNFVGRILGRVSRVDAGTWSIDDAHVVVPPAYDSKVIPARVLLSAALRRAGLKINAPH